jgi:hypothetical protein
MPRLLRVTFYTRLADVASFPDYGELRLGGVTLYGRSNSALRTDVALVLTRIERIIAGTPSLDRRSLLALLSSQFVELPPRVASALVGSTLHSGRLATFSGENESGDVIMLACAPEVRSTFDDRVQQFIELLRDEREVAVRSMRSHFFPNAGSGAWTWSWHIACRAVYLGYCCFLDRYRVTFTGDFGGVLGALD